MRNCVLGIDTSNYTTSLALVAEDGALIANIKMLLPVREGERGLRQSDALFHHVAQLPAAFEAINPYMHSYRICAVGVSEKPRNQEGSYMPCFLAGVSIAEAISTTLGISLHRWSHQCGHITAALYGADALSVMREPFCAFHVSGGTTELVKAQWCDTGYHAEIVGGSRDLHAGQAIDRIGVAMGLPFPAGSHLEKLAMSYGGTFSKKSPKCVDGYIHLSGLENLALKMYDETKDAAMVAAFVFDYIGRGLDKMTLWFRDTYGNLPIVYAGGVMSSSILQERMKKHPNTYFAPPAMSSDNAVGVAVMTLKKHF